MVNARPAQTEIRTAVAGSPVESSRSEAEALAEKMSVMRSERRRTPRRDSEFPTIAPPRATDTVNEDAVTAPPRKLTRPDLDRVMQTVGEYALGGAPTADIDLALEAEGVHPHDAHLIAPQMYAAVLAYRKKRKYAILNGSALVVLGIIGMALTMILHHRAGVALAWPSRLYVTSALHIAAGGIILPLRRIETYWAKIAPISRNYAAGETRLAGQR